MNKILHILTILSFLINVNISSAQDYNFFIKKINAFVYYQDYDSALIYLQKAMILSPDDYKLYIIKGDILLNKKNPNGALNNFLTAEKIKPESCKFKLAQAYSLLKKYAKTYEILNDLLKQRKTTLYNIKKNKNFEKFLDTKYWDKLTTNFKFSSYESLLTDIDFDIKYKNYDDALDKIDQFLEKSSRRHYLYFLKGKILLQIQDTAAAMKSFENAYRIKSNNINYITEYCKLLVLKNKNKKALAILTAKYKKISNKPNTLKWYAIAVHNIGKYKKAIPILKDSIIQYYYKDTLSYYYLALSYTEAHQYFDALKAINKSISLDNNNPEYIFLRGKIYYTTRAYKVAIKDFKYITDLNPTNGKYFFYLAKTLLAQGYKYDACKNFKKAFDLKYMKANDYLHRYCSN
jgi:tetratricopeptide (TPR) repeat protein